MTNAQIKVKSKLEVIKEGEIAQLLVPGEMGAVLELTVKDKNGKVTDHKIMRSKSFVRQFLELLWIMAYPIGEDILYELRDTGNALHWIPMTGYHLASNALASDDILGIIVGTGSTAPTINDYHIETKIDHDALPPTPGAMQYSAVTFGAPASDATTSQFTITRDFANASGGAITVNEVALYVKGYRYGTSFYFMTIRDVITGGISVPDGQTLTVNYRLQAVI